jgi:hypothetical protein
MLQSANVPRAVSNRLKHSVEHLKEFIIMMYCLCRLILLHLNHNHFLTVNGVPKSETAPPVGDTPLVYALKTASSAAAA